MFPCLDAKVDLVKEQKGLFTKIFSKTDNTWKIVIFDQANHDVLSSLYRIKDFRENNITLYFNIKQQRQQLHGVSAIYLLKPNYENVEDIIKDFQKELYSSVIIHFSSEPPSTFFSFFSKELLKRKPSAISRIQKLEYSNIGIQCIDRQMCTLPENNELINLLVMLKNEPLFIYSSSQQTQVELLKQRLQSSAFQLFKSKQRDGSIRNLKNQKKYTKVLLFNRQIDFFPVLSHGVTYASLMQDIWRFNQFGNKLLEKQCQMDLNDFIWLDRKNMLISQMDLEKQCNKIKSKILTQNDKEQKFTDSTEKNKIAEQKYKKIEWHLNIAGQMIKYAKQRRLNQFHEVEEDLQIKKMLTKQNKQHFVELLQTGSEPNDKKRLILTYMISVQNYDQNQVQEFEKLFPDITKNSFYNEIKSRKAKDQNNQGNLNSSKYIKKLAKGIWKNLVNEEKKYLLIKYLEKTKDLTQKNLNELGLKLAAINEIPLEAEIEHTVAYCVGGVCFNEYANLTEFHPHVIYCGDRMVNYRQFI